MADTLRGQMVNEAIRRLTYMPKKAAYIIKPLIESAVANAENHMRVDIDHLYIKTIAVDQGPYLKRNRPLARGSAAVIRKKMSHIRVGLGEKTGLKAKTKGKKARVGTKTGIKAGTKTGIKAGAKTGIKAGARGKNKSKNRRGGIGYGTKS